MAIQLKKSLNKMFQTEIFPKIGYAHTQEVYACAHLIHQGYAGLKHKGIPTRMTKMKKIVNMECGGRCGTIVTPMQY